MTQDNQNIQSDAPNQNMDHQDTYPNALDDGDDGYDPSRVKANDADQRINLKFGEKFVKNWQENGVFRVVIIIVGVITAFILIGFLKFMFGGSDAPTQVNSNKFDAPNTSATEAEIVTPEQYQYIRAQEAVLAKRAQESGESFTPRNLKISTEPQNGGQAVLPSTTNGSTGVTSDQINGSLYNTSQGLNYNGATAQTTAMNQNGSNQQFQQQPQYIPVADYAQPAANQFIQSNNQFAGWYSEETVRQNELNDKAQTDLYTHLEKQIKGLSGEDRKNSNNAGKSNFAAKSYAVAQTNSVNGDNSVNGQGQINTLLGAGASANGQNSANGKASNTLVTAGTRLTARLLNDVNTDDGTQVFAEIMSGKLKGRKVIGAVTATQDNIQFKMSRILSNGRTPEISFDGVGQTLQGSFGMATHIDRHILKNSAAMVASSAAKGYGNAYKDTIGNTSYTGSAVIVNQEEPTNKKIAGNVIGQLGDDFGQKIESIYGNKPTTFRTPVGTVFYIFVNQDIKE